MKFTSILDEIRIPYRESGHEHCRPGWVQLDCPFCAQPGHFRMGYNLAGRYCHCWACGHRPIVETLALLSGWHWTRCKEVLGDVPRERVKELPKRGRYKEPEGVGPLLDVHRSYLRKRGFDPDVIASVWGVKATANAPRLGWRLFIPIVYRGELVSWTTRSINDNHAKRYLAADPESESIDHKTLLYGEDFCGHSVIVHEGPTDVWRTGPGAVALLGTGYKQAQARRISRYSLRVICFDSETAAQRRARELCDSLEVFPGRTINVVLDAKDIAEADEDEVQELRKLIV